MPIPPKHPFCKLNCRACGWTSVVPQLSDVLIGPTECEKCHSPDINRQPISIPEALLTAPRLVGKLLLKMY